MGKPQCLFTQLWSDCRHFLLPDVPKVAGLWMELLSCIERQSDAAQSALCFQRTDSPTGTDLVIPSTTDSSERKSRCGLTSQRCSPFWPTHTQLTSAAQSLLRVLYKEMISQNMDGVKTKEKRNKIKWKHVKNARPPEMPIVVSTKLTSVHGSEISQTQSLRHLFFLPQ